MLELLFTLPLLGSFLILFTPRNNVVYIRNIALYSSLLTFFVSIILWIEFDYFISKFQFVEKISWFSSLNINLVNHSHIATPHIAGHSFEGKVNGTIDILIALMRYLNFDESTVNKNLKIIEGFYPPQKNYYLDLKDFNNNYDISKESKNFKDLFKKYPQNNFNKIRACHPKRHDLSVYNI